MPFNLPAEVIFCCVLGGSLAGSLAYLLMGRMVKIDSTVLKPLSFLVYLALFAAAKIGIEKFGNSFFIVIGLCIGFWIIGIALRGSWGNFSDRITFFGGALLIASLTWAFLLPVFMVVLFIASLFGVVLPRRFDQNTAILLYVCSTLVSVFSAPILEHVFHIAMSMRPKPD